MKNFIETRIINAVQFLIETRVNEIFRDYEILTPIIEFGKFNSAVVPEITINSCETTEKERIVKIDAYSVSITFTVPDTPDSEVFCYGYCHVFNKAVSGNPTLGGVVERAVITEKKYVPPKVRNCGQEWQVVISLRVTVENEQ